MAQDNNNKKQQPLELELDLSPELKETGIVNHFVISRKDVVLTLNHEYNGKRVISSADLKWDKVVSTFEDRLKKKLVRHEHIIQLIDTLDLNYERIKVFGETNGKNKGGRPSSSSRPERVSKYTTSDVSTFKEWNTKLIEKYQNLQDVIQRTLPNLWYSMEFELSVKNILHIKGCTLPFCGIVLGPPSSLKTVGVDLFGNAHDTFYTDHFTAKSFQTHASGLTEEQLLDIDMLPKLKDKLFLTPELAPTFSAKEDDLIENIGILTRILDGSGYSSDSGAQGHREYRKPMIFVWIGVAVDIPYKVHKILATLGPKLYFLRVPVQKTSIDEYYKQFKSGDFGSKKKAVKDALFDYLDWFDICPDLTVDETQDDETHEQISCLKKVEWNQDKDGKEVLENIIGLGKLLAPLRGAVQVWHSSNSAYDIADIDDDEDGVTTTADNYGYGIATIEDPGRAIQQLINLARGHALSQGRNYITKDDLPLVIKVVLSSAASIERVTIFDVLLANGGKLTASRIVKSLNTSKSTVHRTMTELKALGLVYMNKIEEKNKRGQEYKVKQIVLDEEFNWFLTDEFRKLREGFRPTAFADTAEEKTEGNDNSSSGAHKKPSMEKEDEEKQTSSSSRYNEMREAIFWQVYEELENKQASDPSNNNTVSEIDKSTVGGTELRNRLMALKDNDDKPFYSAESEVIELLQQMVKTNKLEKVSFDTYRKVEPKKGAAAGRPKGE
jgi:predicted transcriptional regulator